jgi:hypothetical protein
MTTNNVFDFLRRSADRNNLRRERYEESKVPTDFANICVFPFFGDYRSLFILSSLLLHKYKEQHKASKYLIACSWPGFQSLFPYADEYWSPIDSGQIKRFYSMAEGFKNTSDMATIYTRNLHEFFRDVADPNILKFYYENGCKQELLKNSKCFLPFVPSSAILGKEFAKQLAVKAGFKVFFSPTVYCKRWDSGRAKNYSVKKEFWAELIDKLLSNNYVPVIWQNELTYDLSQDYVDKCLFVNDPDVSKILSAMRATGCVLDVFNGISRFAIAARCPFLAVDERSRYNNLREYEIDDICAADLPKQYIFTFSTIITDGQVQNWRNDILQNIVKRLDSFLPSLVRDEWPSTMEMFNQFDYKNTVREIERKKLGTRLLRVIRD